jgi:hypothetical protein
LGITLPTYADGGSNRRLNVGRKGDLPTGSGAFGGARTRVEDAARETED